MKFKRGEALAVVGALCVLASAVLFGHNVVDAARAARESAAALAAVNAAIAENTAKANENGADGAAAVARESADGAAQGSATPEAIADPDVGVVVDGARYLGSMSVPVLGLELPVYAEWSDVDAQSAPCRYAGSLATGALVIGAHNYDQHFGGISRLAKGDVVVITDANAAEHRYTVAETDILPPDAVDEMKSDAWDLTLFTCTYGGANRVTVRCVAA